MSNHASEPMADVRPLTNEQQAALDYVAPTELTHVPLVLRSDLESLLGGIVFPEIGSDAHKSLLDQRSDHEIIEVLDEQLGPDPLG